MENLFEGSSLLITGGTGSFGKSFVYHTLKKFNLNRIVIFSRDEMKQWEMQKNFIDDKRVRFFLGDIRDKKRLVRALDGIDYVVHAAALKIVPTIEYNPFECVKTNIFGSMNLIDACIDSGVKKVVALSTDKASAPANLYGASKLASDKIFVSGNSYSGGHQTKFSVVRYGNVIGSRGSVIPLFLGIKNNLPFPITDKKMTRFMITLEEGIELVWHSFKDMVGGEIYVKKIPSINIVDIAKAIDPKRKINVIGIRPGEKLHEQMIGEEDSFYTYEYSKYYKILSPLNNWANDKNRIGNGKKVKHGFSYNSKNNKEWMDISTLKNWIKNNKNVLGII